MHLVEAQIIFGVVFACLVILLLIGFFMLLVVVYQRKLRQRQRENFQEVIDAEEKERRRVARELHDGLGASLSAIKMHFDSVRDQLDDRNRADMIHDMLDTACKDVRSISHQMLPQVLINEGLIMAIKSFCQPLKGIPNLKFELLLQENEELRLDASSSLMIYRIIQELLNNALKHAKADHILLQVLSGGNNLNILIEDNGVGILDEQVVEGKGLGLASIRSRVEYLKGSMNIMQAEPQGTMIMLSIPL